MALFTVGLRGTVLVKVALQIIVFKEEDSPISFPPNAVVISNLQRTTNVRFQI